MGTRAVFAVSRVHYLLKLPGAVLFGPTEPAPISPGPLTALKDA